MKEVSWVTLPPSYWQNILLCIQFQVISWKCLYLYCLNDKEKIESWENTVLWRRRKTISSTYRRFIPVHLNRSQFCKSRVITPDCSHWRKSWGGGRGQSPPKVYTGKFYGEKRGRKIGNKRRKIFQEQVKIFKWKRKKVQWAEGLFFFTFWSHWCLFWVYQNGNFYREKVFHAGEKSGKVTLLTPLKIFLLRHYLFLILKCSNHIKPCIQNLNPDFLWPCMIHHMTYKHLTCTEKEKNSS